MFGKTFWMALCLTGLAACSSLPDAPATAQLPWRDEIFGWDAAARQQDIHMPAQKVDAVASVKLRGNRNLLHLRPHVQGTRHGVGQHRE